MALPTAKAPIFCGPCIAFKNEMTARKMDEINQSMFSGAMDLLLLVMFR
jgi:hypothetical protein